MTLANDFIDDEDCFFDLDDFAREIIYSTIDGLKEKSKANFDENSIRLMASEGMETTDAEATILIPNSLVKKIMAVEIGDYIIDEITKTEWEIISIASRDNVGVSLICQTKFIHRLKT